MESALLRADLFRLLALCFDEPSEDALEEIKTLSREIGCFLQFEAKSLHAPLAELSSIAAQTDPGEALVVHHALFTTDVVVSPFESAYHRADRGNVLGDVAGFYAAFGLLFQAQSGPPDRLPNELGYLAWLSLKEAYARETGMNAECEITREAISRFLQDHAARWIPLFVDKLLLSTDYPWYRSAADLLKEVVAYSVQEFDITSVHPLEFPQPATEPEQIVCPAGGVCPTE